MSEKKYSIIDLKSKADEIIASKCNDYDDWYLSAKEIYSSVLKEFFDYLELHDLQKQKRKQLYEQLKAEFEGE